MLQQNLAWIKTPIFVGFSLLWVKFIIKFEDIIHDKEFLKHSTETALPTPMLLAKLEEPFTHIQMIKEGTYFP